MKRFINYIRDTRAELSQVKWPTKKHSVALTIIIILVSLITAGLLGFFDYILSLVIQKFVI